MSHRAARPFGLSGSLDECKLLEDGHHQQLCNCLGGVTMPLHTTQLPSGVAQAPSPAYLIFWASGSPSWCPDCRDAEPAIHAVFGKNPNENHDGPAGYMLYVGDRPTWKDPNNHYRLDYGVQSVPTILRWENGKETGRLEDDDCQDEGKLRAFIERNLYRVSPTALIPSGSVAASARPSSSFRRTQPRDPPGMKAVLSSESLKAFNHALTCLSKFGDNLSLQAARQDDGKEMLRLSTINSSSSAFAAFFFYGDFFEEFNVRLREDYEPTKSAQRSKIECQLHAKALSSILKSRLNRGLERCEIHIVQPLSYSTPASTNVPQDSQALNGNAMEARLLLRLHCAHGVVKTHKLTYEPKKSLYPTANPHPGCVVVVGPRTASEWLDPFLSSKGGGGGAGGSGGGSGVGAAGGAAGPAGEVSLHCGPDFCIVKNKEIDLAARLDSRSGDNRGSVLRNIQTEVRIDLQSFSSYDVQELVHLTFPLKEFKAAVALAESLGFPLEIRFGINDQPLFILISNAHQIATASAGTAGAAAPHASGSSSMPKATYEQGEATLRAEFVLATTQEPDPVEPESGEVPAADAAGGAGAGAGAGPSALNVAAPAASASERLPRHTPASGAEARWTAGSGAGGGEDDSLPPLEPLFRPSQSDSAMPYEPDATPPEYNPLQSTPCPSIPARSGVSATPATILAASGIPQIQFSDHGRFVLRASQTSTRDADEALMANLRTDPPSGVSNFTGQPASEDSSFVLREPEATPLEADDGEAGTPWGATAARAADATDGAVQGSPFASGQAQPEVDDYFFGDDDYDDLDFGYELGGGGVGGEEAPREMEGVEVKPAAEEVEAEDQEEADVPPTPTPPPESDDATQGEDDVERLRRRKKYRPVF
ncbi:unnamed protein product [Tilletia caries]|uniref:Thioredoxin domain-containing protein n=2 Tax=Tilletia TaxID=13289 RepID=A0ABN7J488_9BASI|nr:hypothetical protein CF336_g7415 [Tilletia laevis]CAD6951361.1 unnamed protein product [Tilletia caries]CAD6959093.1 unnamed protein product [Tilletia caries]